MSLSKRVNGIWAVLLSSDDYTVGVQVLAWSLQSVGSLYPLLVLHIPGSLSARTIATLEKTESIILREVDRIIPNEEYKTFHLAQSYYYDTWTKLIAYNLTEYSRIVLIDADMLVRENVDELMTLELPQGWIAASSACVCNPQKIPTYPSHWIPENCAYTNYSKGAAAVESKYFNAGMIVLDPSEKMYKEMRIALSEISRSTFERYKFPDQDFLNHFFRDKWVQLSYIYNGLKPLRHAHPTMWEDGEVKIVHYILQKPWANMNWRKLPQEEREKDQFYIVNTWWFEAYEDMCKSADKEHDTVVIQ